MIHYKISFAGAGNVAGALCRELHNNKNTIEHIVSRNELKGREFAANFNATWSNDYSFPSTSEFIIVSVPDHSLMSILQKIKCNKNSIIVHTAGSMGIDVFPDHLRHHGVLYPLQTFSQGRNPDISSVPFFIEASDNQTLAILKKLAESVSSSVYQCNSERRRLLHLAAVFACNFTNHLLTIGKDISNKAGFPFEVIEPLITETVNKAIEMGPENSQTGPAIRNDSITVSKQLDMLSLSPCLRDIYDLISKSIVEYYKVLKDD